MTETIKELICICCPKGCHLRVDTANDYAVTGNASQTALHTAKRN